MRFSVFVGCFIDGSGGIDIGDYVLMGPNCTILTGNHTFADPDTPICFQPNAYLRTVIGNNVWLGACCTLRPGIRIGDGSIIAAGTTVVKDVPPNAIVAGTPGRIIKYRDGHREEGPSAIAPGAEASLQAAERKDL
jgi:acetyltransferase-like isoleucine patch superfamily enzyme